MLYFVIGLLLGIIIGSNIEFLRNIGTLKYFNRSNKKSNSLGSFALFEIRFKLFILKLYEEKKIHFIIIFYSFLVAGIIFMFIAFSSDNIASENSYFERLLNSMERLNRSIQQDWGR